MTVTFNPALTSNASGTFNTQSTGLVQGTVYMSPNARFDLRGGLLGANESLPMWGGVAITASIPTPFVGGLVANPAALAPSDILGPTITRATNGTPYDAACFTGLAVFDQAHAMINTPQSPVPLASNLQTVSFYDFGSMARIAVAADPILAALETGPEYTRVSWDFYQQRLCKYSAAYVDTAIASATYAAGNVVFTYANTTTTLAAGTAIHVTGCLPVGYNGNYNVVSIVQATNVTTLTCTASASLAANTQLGTITAGGGVFPCRVMDLEIGNCMTVSYSSTTGFATWNRSGTCALIQI
jgi:hypothetical protein